MPELPVKERLTSMIEVDQVISEEDMQSMNPAVVYPAIGSATIRISYLKIRSKKRVKQRNIPNCFTLFFLLSIKRDFQRLD